MVYSPALSSFMVKRIEQLERHYRQLAANPTAEKKKYWFRVSPTCPPSTYIYSRGGVLYESPDSIAGSARGAEVPAASLNLGADDDGTGWINNNPSPAPAFDNAYYYYGMCLFNRGWKQEGYPASLGYGYFYDYIDEYATAAEAEVAVWPNVMDLQGPYLSEFPLAIIILRNNGITGEDGQIMPIDAANRGRSYVWRDVRPRYMVSAAILP